MRMSRRAKGLLAGILFLGTGLPAWAASPPVADVLAFKPFQKGVNCTTPAPQDYDKCKVELVQGSVRGSSGWVLRDSKGAILRRFFDNNADKYPDQWSYYKDGVEIYRELDTNFNGGRDKYVWLNAGGMKVGIDRDENGSIDVWQAISVEELSQEVVRALASKDFRILEPLLVSEDELKTLGTPAGEMTRIKEAQKQAAAKFKRATTQFSHLNENTRWIHIETAAPSRLAAEATGMKQDILMHYRALVYCETGGKADVIQLGEMVQVGEAWKLIDAPTAGEGDAGHQFAGQKLPTDGPTQELVKKLADLDAKAPRYEGTGVNAAVANHHLERSDILEQIVARSTEADVGPWMRQLADSLSTAAQAGGAADTRGAERLSRLTERLARERPGSDLAGYAAFRDLTTDYSLKVASANNAAKMLEIQTKHLEKLAAFVTAYPKADDAPDAVLQVAMINEFQDKEADAKKWYEHLVRNYGTSSQAPRAAGALRRLSLEGRPWELNSPVTSLAGGQFSLDRLRGKIVVVYYWATWCQSAQGDFAKLKQLAQQYRNQGLEVVAISVDEQQADAETFIRTNAAPGYHLYSPGGLESPLATHYGMIVFPNMLLVGRDGKVVNRSVESNTVEEEIKKALK